MSRCTNRMETRQRERYGGIVMKETMTTFKVGDAVTLRKTTPAFPMLKLGRVYIVHDTTPTHIRIGQTFYCMTFFKNVEVNQFIAEKSTVAKPEQTLEHTGGSSSYYDVEVEVELAGTKRKKVVPAIVSCNLIIEALNMNYAQATIFKAVWRICASKLGRKKKGNNTLYDAEKIKFFAERVLVQESK